MVTEDSNDVIGDVTVIEMEEGRSRRVHCDFRTEPLTGGHQEEQVYRYNYLIKNLHINFWLSVSVYLILYFVLVEHCSKSIVQAQDQFKTLAFLMFSLLYCNQKWKTLITSVVRFSASAF